MKYNYKKICDKITDKINEKIEKIDKREAKKVIEIGADGEPTRKLDKIAEKSAIKVIKELERDFYIISEEKGKTKTGKKPKETILLDPIDGTNNAIKGIPFFTTSIAFMKEGKIKMGYVRDYKRNKAFYTRKKSSFKEKKQIKTSKINETKKASISLYYDDSNQLKNFSQRFNHIRRMGCISLELCYVASGKLDAFIDLRGAGIIDIAAGAKLIKNAEGEFKSIDDDFPKRDVQKNTQSIASNKKLFRELKGLIK